MTILQIKSTKSKSKLFWLLPYLVVIVGLFFSYMCLSEFYNVKFGGQGSAYAFGNVNENQWAYQSASNYYTINLICGLIYSATTLLILWATVKKNDKLLIIGIIFFMVLIISDQIIMRV
jgi:NADH:ubiquinone oxidoreductase subunit 3 (subunit A)